MVDPHLGMLSFQQALLAGELQLQRGEVDKGVSVHMDRPEGNIRLSYVRLDGRELTAFAVLAVTEPIEGTPCFQIGVAVPERFRRQGRAKEIMTAALAEMASGFGRAGIERFYVEAIVGVDNEPSKRAAASVLSDDPKEVTDQFSGEPALQYLRLVETKRK